MALSMQPTFRIEPSPQFVQFVEMCRKTRRELFRIFKKEEGKGKIGCYNRDNDTQYTARDFYEQMVDDDRFLDSLLGGEGQTPEEYAKRGFMDENAEY